VPQQIQRSTAEGVDRWAAARERNGEAARRVDALRRTAAAARSAVGRDFEAYAAEWAAFDAEIQGALGELAADVRALEADLCGGGGRARETGEARLDAVERRLDGLQAALAARRDGVLAALSARRGRVRRSSELVHTTARGEASTMTSTIARPFKPAIRRLRTALGVKGVLSIVFGLVTLIWPGLSLAALTILFGAYATVTGVVGLVSAIRGEANRERGMLVFTSIVGIVLGVVALAWPGLSALALLYVIAAYAVTFGVVTVGSAFWLPVAGSDRALLGLSGLVSILFGLVMFAKPGAGALVVLGLIAAAALVAGITELAVAIGGERLIERRARGVVARAVPRTSH